MTPSLNMPIRARGTPAEADTYLAQQAATLSAGQCRLLDTGLLGSTLIFGGEGADFIQWGSSAYYDPLRKEVGFIGKRHSTHPYHWLVYDEASNTWSNDRAVWSTDNASGHGYDHNTIDPATGTVYHREYNGAARSWDGESWSSLGSPPSANIVGGLSWFPGVGLIYNDGDGLKRYSGGSWSTLASYGGGSYHDCSEYNATANVLIFGGGNESPWRKLTSGLSISDIEAPPVSLGAGSTQGPLCSVPGADQLIGYAQDGGTFHQYDISADAWSSLTKSTGDGSSPQTGLPALGNTGESLIAACIEAYGVQMWIRYKGSGSTPAEVWLYKH